MRDWIKPGVYEELLEYVPVAAGAWATSDRFLAKDIVGTLAADSITPHAGRVSHQEYAETFQLEVDSDESEFGRIGSRTNPPKVTIPCQLRLSCVTTTSPTTELGTTFSIVRYTALAPGLYRPFHRSNRAFRPPEARRKNVPPHHSDRYFNFKLQEQTSSFRRKPIAVSPVSVRVTALW